MEFIVFVIAILVLLYLYIGRLLDRYGKDIIVYIILFSILFGLALADHTEYAGEGNPYSEIHLADSNGNVYEIIRMKDGEIVERIELDNSVPK